MRRLRRTHMTALALICLLGAALCGMPQEPEPGTGEMVFIENGTPLATETLGAEWIEGDGVLVSGGTDDIRQRILGRATIGPGDCHVRARLAIGHLDDSAAAFTVGASSYFGFEGGHGKMFVTGPLFDDARGTPIGDPEDFVQDSVPFEFDFIREGDTLSVLIDGKLAY
ncbi:MAG: hypothetical protein ACP5KN_02965, partial [Armatimonadota bacterium]